DRDRGKFRTFLLTALEHYSADQFDQANAQKRGGGRTPLSLNFGEAEGELTPKVEEAPDKGFRRDWALCVLTRAMDAVRNSFESAGKTAEFETFKLHLTSTRPEGVSYEEMAAALRISVSDVRNRIRSARARYREE